MELLNLAACAFFDALLMMAEEPSFWWDPGTMEGTSMLGLIISPPGPSEYRLVNGLYDKAHDPQTVLDWSSWSSR